jgi:hypothetical protein
VDNQRRKLGALLSDGIALMQPRYYTVTSSLQSTWYLVNWHATPQQVSFAAISTGGSSWNINVCFEDPTGTFPSPNSSSPTAFPLVTGGSSNQFVTIGSSMAPIAGFQFALTSASTGGKIFFCVNQSGIG